MAESVLRQYGCVWLEFYSRRLYLQPVKADGCPRYRLAEIVTISIPAFLRGDSRDGVLIEAQALAYKQAINQHIWEFIALGVVILGRHEDCVIAPITCGKWRLLISRTYSFVRSLAPPAARARIRRGDCRSGYKLRPNKAPRQNFGVNAI